MDMTYKETLDYLYRALPMFSRIGGAAIKKDITNTRILCERIGNPQRSFKSVHVAGTNGKGSVSHMLAAVLQKAGYTVGLYTSPHLKDFRERIKVKGAMVTEEFVTGFTGRMLTHIEEIQPSFFEITVAMAFEYFALNRVDIAVIETGLGGRLDSTNIIIPEISVITNIGLDHMDILGDSLEKIAGEKAGIIKEKVPVVIGETHKDTKKVFITTAREKQAPIVFADAQRYADDWRYSAEGLSMEIVNSHSNEKQMYLTDLGGLYQSKNIITVLSALELLKQQGWILKDEAIAAGLKQVKKLTGLHGRWEVVHHHPTIVLDVGHNEDGIRQVCNQLEMMDYHHLHIIMGMVKDKDVSKVLKLLPREASYYFTRAQIPRAMPEEQLMGLAAANGLQGNCFGNVNAALQQALQHCNKNDLIVVCGSVFVVGEVDITLLKNI